MFYNSKYFCINSGKGIHYFDPAPKVYIDYAFYGYNINNYRTYKYKEIVFSIGFYRYSVNLEFKWGYCYE